MKVLAIAYEVKDAGELAKAVKEFNGEADILAVSRAAEQVNEVARYSKRVYRLASKSPYAIYKALENLVERGGYQLLIAEGYRNLRDALSRLAGSLDLPMITDAYMIRILDGEKVLVERGFLSERAKMKVEVPLPAIVLFIPRFTEPLEPGEEGEVIELAPTEGPEKVLDVKPKAMGDVNLEEADIIVGVGRGFKAKEDLHLAFELAELLGGQVGCTRPIAADLKWLSEDRWIGISGKRVAPKLYIAIGISGSPQHMSGVQNAKIIVAINKDKSAPIFKQADYGVVADLYQFVPILIQKLKEKKAKG